MGGLSGSISFTGDGTPTTIKVVANGGLSLISLSLEEVLEGTDGSEGGEEGFNGLSEALAYRYGFQGQEEDGETGWVNYKYRMHDPVTGRFFAVDPLYRIYPWNSSYAFSENRVIDGVELEGLEYRNATRFEIENFQQFGNGNLSQGDVGYVYQTGENSFQTWVGENQYIAKNELGINYFSNSRGDEPLYNEKVTFDSKAYITEDGYSILQEGGMQLDVADNEFGVVWFLNNGPGFERYSVNGISYGNNEDYQIDGWQFWADNYASKETAASFYNLVQDFHSANPNVVIHYGDISAYDPAIDLGHSTHFSGNSIDIHYFDSHGRELRGDNAYMEADVSLTNDFLRIAQRFGFNTNYTWGGRFMYSSNQYLHDDHLHIGR